jgi:hypothetical protein
MQVCPLLINAQQQSGPISKACLRISINAEGILLNQQGADFLLDALDRAFSALGNNLSGASLVNNSESTHAHPKPDAIHAAEGVRPIVRLGGPTGIMAMLVGSRLWRIELIQLTFAAANWLL